jgi:hypothetical protein
MSNELSEMDVNDELGEALQAVLQVVPYEPYPIARANQRLARGVTFCDLRPPFSVQFTVSPRLRFAPRSRLFPAKPS